ncbi:PEP-CTERM sorting domain-containing protein [Paludisphaera borealis]|uniref:Ice-binding protein C-terminal domain-containing protein n=1 Tax=Paludisphaera borealis TaxID=1387353 RepID=A0A1U7CL98_9BACT|nr:PEP-CTERM sorting domain-containing protein [Paludisphaera borealis]APW59687.1 hypothetical protein BSF38_01117 [Paludisphaera borealis]
MIKLHRALMAGALFVLAAVPAQAATEVAGALSLVGFGDLTSNSLDLSVPNLSVTAAQTLVSKPGNGDFSVVPLSTDFGPNTVDVTNLSAFTLTNATYGKFTATSGTVVGTPTSGFINIYILGTFTPLFGGFGPSPASVQITITSSSLGGLSEAITINAPPTSIPEPASIAMAGIGLAAAGLVRVLRKRSV